MAKDKVNGTRGARVVSKVIRTPAPKTGCYYTVATTRGAAGTYTKKEAEREALKKVQVDGYSWAVVLKPVTYYRKL